MPVLIQSVSYHRQRFASGQSQHTNLLSIESCKLDIGAPASVGAKHAQIAFAIPRCKRECFALLVVRAAAINEFCPNYGDVLPIPVMYRGFASATGYRFASSRSMTTLGTGRARRPSPRSLPAPRPYAPHTLPGAATGQAACRHTVPARPALILAHRLCILATKTLCQNFWPLLGRLTLKRPSAT